jgi:hypothetical protein
MKPKWNESNYFYDEDNGRVLGLAFKYANQNVVWCAKVYTDEIPFTPENEKHLGQFISCEFARKMIENYWLMHTRTLLER